VLTLLAFAANLYMAPWIAIGNIKPDLVLLLMLFYFFRVNWKRAPLIAVFLGLFRDVFSTRLFGVETLALGLATWITSAFVGKFEREDPLLMIPIAWIFCVLYEIIAWTTLRVIGETSAVWQHLPSLFWVTAYTALALPFAIRCCELFVRSSSRRRPEAGFFR